MYTWHGLYCLRCSCKTIPQMSQTKEKAIKKWEKENEK